MGLRVPIPTALSTDLRTQLILSWDLPVPEKLITPGDDLSLITEWIDYD